MKADNQSFLNVLLKNSSVAWNYLIRWHWLFNDSYTTDFCLCTALSLSTGTGFRL